MRGSLVRSRRGPRTLGRGSRRLRFAASIVLGVATAAAGPAPAAGQPPPALPSLIEIPVEVPLGPLFAEIERLTPRQAGHWGHWKSVAGVDTQYRAWRGSLGFTATNEGLLVQAHVRYWVKARANLFKAIPLEASCGVDEAPRQAVIRVLARLDWGPDWLPLPRFRVLPTRFLDRCEMTVADLDVTPIIDRVFEHELRDSIRRALGSRQGQLAGFRERAAGIWVRLQEPVELATGVWLALSPFAAALSPPQAVGERGLVRLGVAMLPEIAYGDEPVVRRLPLPPLAGLPGVGQGLRFRFSLTLDWDRLSGLLSAALQGRTLEVRERELGIASVRLSAHAGQLAAEVALTGDAAGRAEIWGDPVLGPGPRPLRLEGLDYVYEPDDPATGLLADAFYLPIRDALLRSANDLLERQLEAFRERVAATLAQVLPPQAVLDLADLELSSGALRVLESGVELSGVASGGVRLALRGGAAR